MPTRRQVLAGLGAAVVGTTSSGTASATHDESQPAHVTIEYDEDWLDTYKPKLDRSQQVRDKFLGLYGWKASSPDYDTEIGVFWCSYSNQEGYTSLDSHRGDHEPVLVEVDAASGDVETVAASIWHWQQERVEPDQTRMDGTNPLLRIDDRHHHYTVAPPTASPEVLDVKDLRGAWSDWRANGLEEAVVVGASLNPWIMESQRDWWQSGEFFPSYESFLTARQLEYRRLFSPDTVGSLEA